MNRIAKIAALRPKCALGAMLFTITTMLLTASWVLSYWECIEINFEPRGYQSINVGNFFGLIRIMRWEGMPARWPREFFVVVLHPASKLPSNIAYRPQTFMGFGYSEAISPKLFRDGMRTYWLPNWPLILASGTTAIFFARPLKAARRRLCRLETGLCANCGYDLRGTEVSASSDRRCPECGFVSSIPPKSPER